MKWVRPRRLASGSHTQERPQGSRNSLGNRFKSPSLFSSIHSFILFIFFSSFKFLSYSFLISLLLYSRLRTHLHSYISLADIVSRLTGPPPWAPLSPSTNLVSVYTLFHLTIISLFSVYICTHSDRIYSPHVCIHTELEGLTYFEKKKKIHYFLLLPRDMQHIHAALSTYIPT